MSVDAKILEVASHFRFDAVPVTGRELTDGIINATYCLDFEQGADPASCVIQRINTNVFKNPEALMENIARVTAHIYQALVKAGEDPARRVLSFVEADHGGYLYRDPEGGCWRAYYFVDNVTAHQQIENPSLFYEAGRGFGEFQTLLADFPAEQLSETIPNFHNTRKRYETLCASAAADKMGRAAEVAEELAFFAARKDAMCGIVDRLATGVLPLRVTHNDTKLNNVLLDNDTGKAMCVIDLDTVMPGSSLYDFGDAIRFGTNTAAEDEPDTSKIGFDMELFKAFARGFVEKTAGYLTDAEIRLLPLGAEVMTYEVAVRFLTDYLDGDVYFKTKYPGHNLVRARAQIKLLSEMEKRRDDMYAYVEKMLNI